MWKEVHTYQEKSLDWFCVTVEVAFGYRINNGSFNFKYIQMPFFVLKMCDKRLGKDQIRKKQKQNKFKGYSTNSTYMIFRRKYSWGNFHKFCTWQYKNHLPTLGYTNILGKSSLFCLVETFFLNDRLFNIIRRKVFRQIIFIVMYNIIYTFLYVKWLRKWHHKLMIYLQIPTFDTIIRKSHFDTLLKLYTSWKTHKWGNALD